MKTLTKHRKWILENLQGRMDHPTAKMVFESAKGSMEKISFATVYNSLEYLVNAGKIRKLNIQSESCRYDANLSPHSHLICTKCESIMDIPSLLEKDKLLSSFSGFSPQEISVTIYGQCDSCNGDKNPSGLGNSREILGIS
jgi:Fur family peroxide stress response transcriptional regulator